MSEEIKIVLPKLGESIHSATIVQWFKKIGDTVQLDEPLLEVSTDKVNSEIPSPVAGILREIHAHPDQELQVGDLLAVVASGAASVPQAVIPGASAASPSVSEQTTSGGEMSDFFSPALLRLARENKIGLDELEKITGTGAGGRLTKKDLEIYIEKKGSACRPCPAMASKPSSMPTSAEISAEIERLKMSGMRKAIADNMVRSFYEAPHATLVTEVDVTAIIKLIQKEKDAFASRHGFKLTITSFVARAVATALQEFPLINSSLEGDTILVKRFVNLGIAVSIEQGLVVPVIKNAQKMGLTNIAKSISELSLKARSGKLTQDDINDGTISMTNFGMSGVQIGVPIIRYPEVAIVGIGAICKKVVPLEDDVLAVRSMVHISLTFDHRVLDGMYGCGFLGALKKHLEEDQKVD
ncbi:MAG: 2-oxo acid dehydrogenase subunit E2 [Parachlamydiales bacterium]|nr:2-oxo acid dehydrogenase subunit E2 [Candidatus Acheromyda pituitae]